MSGNILFLGNKIFEIPPFFQTRPGDLGKKSSRMLITFFRPEEQIQLAVRAGLDLGTLEL